MAAVLCSPPAGAFPQGCAGCEESPNLGIRDTGKIQEQERKDHTLLCKEHKHHAAPQPLQGSVISLLPFNLIHIELPNFKLTLSASSHLFVQTHHELLYLCKHTRAPSSSSSKLTQLPPTSPTSTPTSPKPGEHSKASQQRYSGFNSCSAQRAQRVITFASPGLNRTRSSCQQLHEPHSSRAG